MAKTSETKTSTQSPDELRKAAPFVIETNVTRSRYLKFLVYGDYGVGKTYLAGTAVEVSGMNDILLINAEAGDLTLDSDEYAFNKICSVRVKDFTTMAKVYEYLKLHCQLRDANDMPNLCKSQEKLTGIATKKPFKFHTVIIDSLTEVETHCMYQILGINDSTKLDEEVASPEWSDYGRNLSMVQRMIRNFRDLPMHVIFTCGRAYKQDDMKKFSYSPMMTGKLSNQVQGFVDLVGYLTIGSINEAGEIPRRLFVHPSGRFAAKCRFSSYKSPYFDDPTIKGILKAVGLLSSTSKKGV